MTDHATTIGLAALARDPTLSPETVYTAIARSELALRQTLTAFMADAGLPCDPAFEILLEVYTGLNTGKLRTPGDVACNASLAASSATRWIRILEQRGLLERHGDALDRRRVFLTLTDRAVVFVERAIEIVGAARAAFTPCPADAKQMFFSR